MYKDEEYRTTIPISKSMALELRVKKAEMEKEIQKTLTWDEYFNIVIVKKK